MQKVRGGFCKVGEGRGAGQAALGHGGVAGAGDRRMLVSRSTLTSNISCCSDGGASEGGAVMQAAAGAGCRIPRPTAGRGAGTTATAVLRQSTRSALYS